MAAVTVEEYIQTFVNSLEKVRVTVANTGDTYVSRKFAKVRTADFTIDEDQDAYVNTSLSGGAAIDGTSKTVQINLSAGTNVTGVLTLTGYK